MIVTNVILNNTSFPAVVSEIFDNIFLDKSLHIFYPNNCLFYITFGHAILNNFQIQLEPSILPSHRRAKRVELGGAPPTGGLGGMPHPPRKEGGSGGYPLDIF